MRSSSGQVALNAPKIDDVVTCQPLILLDTTPPSDAGAAKANQ